MIHVFPLLLLLCFAPQSIHSQNAEDGDANLPGLSRQELLQIREIEALLDEEGRFLAGPLEIPRASEVGKMLPQVLESRGIPLRMFPLRGEEPWMDDVVFFYDDYSYLYWYEDRVWQIRFDNRFASPIAGVRMGMNLEEVSSILGPPRYIGNNSLYFDLVDPGYPLRARFVFDDNILKDVYIYRSDF